MKMFKKIITCVLCFILSTSFVASATLTLDISPSEDSFIVSGASDEDAILISVFKPNKSNALLHGAITAGTLNYEDYFSYYRLAETQDGSFSQKVMMPSDSVAGDYVIMAGDEVKMFSFLPLSLRLSILQEIINATDASDVRTCIDNNNSNMGLWEIYQNLSNKDLVADVLFERKDDFVLTEGEIESWEKVIKLANTGVLVEACNENLIDSIDVIKERVYEDESIEVLYSLFDKMTAEGKAEILNNVNNRSFVTYSGFSSALKKQIVLQAFNYAYPNDADVLENVIESYGDLLGLNLNSYALLNDSNKALVVKRLYAAQCSVSDIVSKFNEIVAAFSTKDNSDSSPNITEGRAVVLSNNSSSTTPNKNIIPTKQKKEFSDMGNFAWANEAVSSMQERKIIDGYEDGTFKPGNAVTRAEFVTMITRAIYKVTEPEASAFSDVSTDHWAYKYIMTAYKNGIINGVEEGIFLPDSPIKREDVAVILANILNDSQETDSVEKFSDDADIADYASNSVYLLKKLGIIEGSDGIFAPKSTTTRAEAAQMIYNFLNSRSIVLEEDDDNGKNIDEYNLLSALSIVDNTFEYNYKAAVKRDSFMTMVMKAMGLNYAKKAAGNVYSDVTASNENAPAIELYAGLIGAKADGTEEYRPHDNIVLGDAVKIILDVTGYINFANAKGTNGISIVANDKDLLRNVEASWEEEISGNDALMLLRNMLWLNKIEVTSPEKMRENPDETIIESVHGVYEVKGVIVENSLTGLYTESSLANNKILLESDGMYRELDCGNTDIADDIGLYATVYYRKSNSDPEPVVVYCDSDNSKNDVVTVNIDDLRTLSDSKILYTVGNNVKKKELKLSSDVAVLYNKTYCAGVHLNEADLYDMTGNLTVIDNDGDGKYEVVKITAYNSYIINNALMSEKQIYDVFNPDVAIDIDDDNFTVYNLRYADGGVAEIADITYGSVVSIAENAVNCRTRVIDIILSEKRVTGVATEYDNETVPKMVIDYNNSYKVLHDALPLKPNVGTGVMVYLDAFDNVVYINTGNNGEYYYGLLVGTDYRAGGFDPLTVKIFSEDDTMHIYEVKSNVTIDGHKCDSESEVYTILTTVPEFTVGQTGESHSRSLFGAYPVRYCVNSEDKITRIDIPSNLTSAEDEPQSSLTHLASGYFACTDDYCLGGTIPYTSKTLTLVVGLPNDASIDDLNEENCYFTSAASTFSVKKPYNVSAFRLDSNSYFADFMVKTTSNYSGAGDDSFFTVISSVGEAYDPETEETYTCVYAYTGGSEEKLLISKDFEADFVAGNYAPGDVIFYSKNDSDGTVIAMENVVKYGVDGSGQRTITVKEKPGQLNTSYGRSTELNKISLYGVVKRRQEGLVQVLNLNSYPTNEILSAERDRGDAETGDWFGEDYGSQWLWVNIGSSIPVTVFDASKDKNHQVYAGTYDDIKDYIHNGSDYSRIIFRYRSSALKEVLVFNDKTLTD